MNSQAAFETQVINALKVVATSHEAQIHKIDPQKFAISGFSAGGFLALTAAFRYRSDPSYTIQAAVSFYGSDLASIHTYHRLRAKDRISPSDPFFGADKSGAETCRAQDKNGFRNILCSTFSTMILQALPMGETTAPFFSPLTAATEKTLDLTGLSISASFGLYDDNVVPFTSVNAIRQAAEAAAVDANLSIYPGPHGVTWYSANAGAVDWLKDKLVTDDPVVPPTPDPTNTRASTPTPSPMPTSAQTPSPTPARTATPAPTRATAPATFTWWSKKTGSATASPSPTPAKPSPTPVKKPSSSSFSWWSW